MATTTRTGRNGFKLAGFGVVACVACCAAPILGLAAAAGIATVLGYVVFGVVTLAVGAGLVVLAIRIRTTRRAHGGPTAVQITEKRPR